MSTQTRTSGGGRNQKKSNTVTGGGGGGGSDPTGQTVTKKTDVVKTEKEKGHIKPTAEQLRIAQITNSNTNEDPQMREKVATLIEMTQRSEEEVCCALYECDNNLEKAVVFLLETLPVGAFETSSKKKKNKAANAAQEGEGEWNDSNANTDKREKSRNRSSNRGGRGGTDSRGWRGRESRENDRNLRESRGDRDRGGDRGDDNYRRGGGRSGGGRGGSYMGRGGRGGGRMGGLGRGPRNDRGSHSYGSRQNTNEDHQEVELWDNTIAQNAEKQQQSQDDAWGDWDNEEYMGSLKESQVFTPSNLSNQTTANVVSGNTGGTSELSAPPGLEHHLGTSVLGGASSQQQGSHLNALVGSAVNAGSNLVEDASSVTGVQNSVSSVTSPLMQYSAAVNNTALQQQSVSGTANSALTGASLNASQYNSAVDSFTNASAAAANLVQQVQQHHQQPQIKPSGTLSAEQSQYFNSLTSQSAAAANVQQQQMVSYAQNSGVQYPTSYANVFGNSATSNVGGSVTVDQTQLSNAQQPQVRRTRPKLPPPSKIPSTAVEMPGDTLNNIGYLDVQFGGLDFGNEDSFDTLSEKFNNSVTIDAQQQQLVQSQQDVTNDYQGKTNVQPSTLTTGLQNSQIGDSLSTSYVQRSSNQQQQVSSNVNNVASVSGNNNALDQLAKNDPYNQSNSTNATGYQSSYQTNPTGNKSNNAYQQNAPQGYTNSSYVNVQSSAANTYQPQYGSYQQNSVNTYQQSQQTGAAPSTTNAVVSNNVSGSGSSSQNIPVGGNGTNSSTGNTNAAYLSTGYPSQQNSYQTSQNVYGNTGLTSNTGFAGSTSTSSSQYSNFSTSAKLKDTTSASNTTHFDSASSNSASNSNTSVSSVSSAVNAAATAANSISSTSLGGLSNSKVSNSASSNSVNANSANSVGNNNTSATNSANSVSSVNNNNVSSVVAATASASTVSSGNKNSAANNAGMVSNIQMQGFYDLNYTPTSLGAGRDNLGSVAYSTMTDGRFARTDNNSSPVSNVSSTMSQQAGSSAPMLNVPYAYFYGGNVMPGGFQYGTPAIYPQQIPAANTASGGQFPKPSYNTGYGSTSYDALTQASQDYTKGAYPSNVNQPTKSQNVTNPQQGATGSDITSSMYGKGHVALNKVNSYEKQNFHSGTPPPFNMSNTQTAGGASAQPYGMYLPMPAAGHHNMIHQPIHQMDGRIHNSSRRDSNSTGQRQQASSQAKSAAKQNYSPSYWTGQN
ncbi:protein lingerer-like isoform X4 [Teleopsis dalmanni]|uniref:protein lingerer-like isoform X4 n=2 Tax=Teleopsis dalmanni TaxID=139649 RepID=UPI0018CECE46|nr:protein lingerer-like isoform X4 [Teleopsis dalmanni]